METFVNVVSFILAFVVVVALFFLAFNGGMWVFAAYGWPGLAVIGIIALLLNNQKVSVNLEKSED